MAEAATRLESRGTVSRTLVHGVELAVSRQGHGPPLLCLHAVGHARADYADFARRFADRYEVICVDWPGHGESGPDLQPISAARYAELLIGLSDQLAIEAPIVIGNSIGGTAAIRYASKRPVRALVLCDSGGLVRVDRVVRLFCALFAAFFAQGARGAAWFSWAYALYYRRIVLPEEPARERREQIIAHGPELAPLLRDAWRSFGRPDADLRAELEALPIPIWFAWGKRDRVIPFTRIKASVARCALGSVTLFDAGHSAFLECPDAFAEGFTRFMQTRAQPSLARKAAASGS